jgi:hypothetical protein
METQEIEIQIYDKAQKMSGNVYVEQLTENTFRMTENDIFNCELTRGTEFETKVNKDGFHEIVKIIKKSDFITRSFWLSPTYKQTDYLLLGEELVKNGGFWQVDFGGIAIINIPQDFDLEKIMEECGINLSDLTEIVDDLTQTFSGTKEIRAKSYLKHFVAQARKRVNDMITKFVILFLVINNSYCQNFLLCPQYDSAQKAWAFVDNIHKKQILAPNYKHTVLHNYSAEDYLVLKEQELEKQAYFWSKLDIDSLKILDMQGNILLATTKSTLPPIQNVKVICHSLFQLFRTDTLGKYWGADDRSLIIDNKGKICKFKGKDNLVITDLDSVNKNYIATVKKVMKDTVSLYGFVLVDKNCKPLSRIYDVMYKDLSNNAEFIMIMDNKTGVMGCLDYNGKVIVPIFNDYNYIEIVNKDYTILKLKGKFGVANNKGIIIIPAIYNQIIHLYADLFIVKDMDNSGEYVINSKQKALCQPVFYNIDSISNDKVWQICENKKIAYSLTGKCLECKEEPNFTGYMAFLKDTRTNIIYSQATPINNKIKDFEVILINSKNEQFVVLKGNLTYAGGRKIKKIFNKIISFDKSNQLFNTETLTIEEIVKKDNSENIKFKGIFKFQFYTEK